MSSEYALQSLTYTILSYNRLKWCLNPAGRVTGIQGKRERERERELAKSFLLIGFFTSEVH